MNVLCIKGQNRHVPGTQNWQCYNYEISGYWPVQFHPRWDNSGYQTQTVLLSVEFAPYCFDVEPPSFDGCKNVMLESVSLLLYQIPTTDIEVVDIG